MVSVIRTTIQRTCILILLLFTIPACNKKSTTTNDPVPSEYPQAVIETAYGTMVLDLWIDVAPEHCRKFDSLATAGFYDGLTIHRVVPGFVIQGGDPLGNGTGGPGYTIDAEFSDKPFVEGTLGMARATDPNSAGSQFFIALGRLTSLDGKYTVFGQLTGGLDVLRTIEKVPTRSEYPITPVVMARVYVIAPDTTSSH